MRPQPSNTINPVASEQPWPYMAVVEYWVGEKSPKHVICAESPEGLRKAFEAVNADVEGAERYIAVEGCIVAARVMGPRCIVDVEYPTLTTGWYEGISGKNISDAIRSLEMR